MTSAIPKPRTDPSTSKPSCKESLARIVATTKGDLSLAALALKEFHRRRQAGEEVIVYPLRGKWIVATESEVLEETRAASAKTRTAQRLARAGR